MGILEGRRANSRRRGLATVVAISLLQCTIIGWAYLINTYSFDSRLVAMTKRTKKEHARMSLELYEARVRYDILHGIWHVLSSTFGLLASLLIVEGLSGRLQVSLYAPWRECFAALLLFVWPSAFGLCVINAVSTRVLLCFFCHFSNFWRLIWRISHNREGDASKKNILPFLHTAILRTGT